MGVEERCTHKGTNRHEQTHTHTHGRMSHLEGLEAEANVVSLRHGDPPHTLLGRPVVVGVVGGLDLPRVFGDFPSTDGCTGRRQTGRISVK